MPTTDGWLLDGRVRYSQPEAGYRTGIEPVLLAASVPVRGTERVLEAGVGAGAGLLCLAARVPGVKGVGIEIDPATAELARRNIGANGMDSLAVVTAEFGAWGGDGGFDHTFSNPPWHDPAATASPTGRRRLAMQEGDLLLEGWIGLMRAAVRPGGSLTLMVPAGQTGRVMAALRAAGVGRLALAPLWPKAGRAAKLLLVQGIVGRRDPDRLTPGLVLHEADGRFSAAAQSLLRDGAAWVI